MTGRILSIFPAYVQHLKDIELWGAKEKTREQINFDSNVEGPKRTYADSAKLTDGFNA